MTILHVTDLHFTERWFAWLHESAPAHDLLCITGDLLDQTRPIPYRQQASLVAEWLRLLNRPVCVCSGNHDLEFMPPGQPRRPAFWLRGISGPRLWTDENTARLGEHRVHVIGYRDLPAEPADIWVAHLPPAGSPVALTVRGFDAGDEALARSVAILRPRLVLSGHVHQPTAWIGEVDGTVHLNPGCSRSSRIPNHILIDPIRGTASRVTEGPLGSDVETVSWATARPAREERCAA